MCTYAIPSGAVRLWAAKTGAVDHSALLLVMGANASSALCRLRVPMLWRGWPGMRSRSMLRRFAFSRTPPLPMTVPFLPATAHARAYPVRMVRGAELGRVRVATLVIQGDEDPLNPPPHGRHLAWLIPGARLLEIPGLRHALAPAFLAQIADMILCHVHGGTAGDDPGAA